MSLPEDTLEKAEGVLQKLAEDNEKYPMVVEGLRDVKALRAMGFTGTIIHINTGHSLLVFAEQLAGQYREVILLPDFDEHGVMLLQRLEHYFMAEGVRCHTEHWARLRSVLGSRISEIEELPSLLNEEKII
ncbi:MAG: hypothetical protein GXO25_00780 [Euryarchaeota archaeon]|nr:hypothetical protein [Euryarchaeota archaeon]